MATLAVERLKEIPYFSYRLNRYAAIDIENTVRVIDHLLNGYLEQQHSDITTDRLSTSDVVISFTPYYYLFRSFSYCDVEMQLQKFTKDRLQLSAKLIECHKRGIDDYLCAIQILRTDIEGENVTRTVKDYPSKNQRKYHRNNPIHTCCISIRLEDLNERRQITLGTYIAYCQHAASEALDAGKLKDMTEYKKLAEIYQIRIQIFSLLGAGNLLIDLWQDKDDADRTIIYFNIRSNSTIVCCATFLLDSSYTVRKLSYQPLPMQALQREICTYFTPGFYSRRDRFGNARLDDLLRYKVNSDKMTLNISQISGLKMKYDDGRFMVVRNEVDVTAKFYDIDPDSSIRNRLQVASIGNSSIITDHDLLLGSCQLIRVSTKLASTSHGKVVKIPEDFKEINIALTNKRTYSKVASPRQLPSKAYKYSVTARSDDIDINDHVNNGVYVLYCYDAAGKAVTTGSSAYHWPFGNDFNPACIRKLSCNYYKQSTEHQVLDIFTWQDDHDNNLHFVVRRGDADLFYMTAVCSIGNVAKM